MLHGQILLEMGGIAFVGSGYQFCWDRKHNNSPPIARASNTRQVYIAPPLKPKCQLSATQFFSATMLMRPHFEIFMETMRLQEAHLRLRVALLP